MSSPRRISERQVRDAARRAAHESSTQRHERPNRPVLRLMPTTLWEFPSQHYDSWVDPATGKTRRASRRGSAAPMQGDARYAGATPSWVVWQAVMRFTEPGDLVVDPMAGSGTTLDVARDTGRRAAGFDLNTGAVGRDDVVPGDARKLPIPDGAASLVFIDPPYSTHIAYSDDPRCIGKLDAGGADGGRAYYAAMERVIAEARRVLRPGGVLAIYVSDSWRKRGDGEFMAIGFELFSRMRAVLEPLDIVCVVRHAEKLTRGNWRRSASEGGFMLRGFNYLLLGRRPGPGGTGAGADSRGARRGRRT